MWEARLFVLQPVDMINTYLFRVGQCGYGARLGGQLVVFGEPTFFVWRKKVCFVVFVCSMLLLFVPRAACAALSPKFQRKERGGVVVMMDVQWWRA